MKKLIFALCLLNTPFTYAKVKVKNVSPQTNYASSLLTGKEGQFNVSVEVADNGEAEGFTLLRKDKHVRVIGNDGAGTIYGVNKLLELLQEDPTLSNLTTQSEVPQMKLRGACVGLQKTVYLPGHRVYEYPYTPENFPWFYDKTLWIKYLDLLAENNMNTVYLWNGHPFASLVKLKDYPFAPEVDDETMQKNQEMFGFLVDEADRRGIRVIQMFYNIILSKPFADHYGLKTQDRNRPITPLIADYTRKSIAAFIEKYPKVGFLICLGEAMSGIDNDIKWMTETVIPGIKDGLKASGRTDLPPIILRNHDTDGPAVLKASLPLYPNIYTMNKYTGESLTTYEPGGPWGETHRMLAAAAPIHIDNVHILANLEPWRWSSPAFTQKAVQAMHRVHHSKGLHLYPQASYWDWPYTADKLPNGERLLQIDRDWMWYKAWGRYAWSDQRGDDKAYWKRLLADYYGISKEAAEHLLNAYDESGEIAPKLLRRFGITEGNRQTLLLGMTMGELVNPYKYTIYPGFYESCGPQGEKLIEYVEKEWKGEKHVGELPLDIVNQCVEHQHKAVEALNAIVDVKPLYNADEFERFRNDIICYSLFALSFRDKVLAAQQVLNYKWTKNINYLDAAIPLLEKSVYTWNLLAQWTDSIYLYANSMQTAQRRIPVGGDDGKMKTWSELAVVYQDELDALKTNIEKLKHPVAQTDANIQPATPARVKLYNPNAQLITLKKGAIVFENRPDTPVDSVAPELVGMRALVLNRDTTRIVGTTIEFESDKPVKLLVGLFKDDDPKWAKAPKLEIDATGNEYGQAEPLLTNAISIVQMPKVNIHQYTLSAGHQTLHLPKGILMVAGFTQSDINPRDCGLNGPSSEVDWLFQK
ncbi:MAG: hypothetical protein IJ804_00580 [Prevotella sp.]|nr:hypothetical protein [Prevotella sp.]